MSEETEEPTREITFKATIRCDGCGAIGEMWYGADHSWHKPSQWYERADEDGPQTACSRECISRIANKSGKTGLVLPI